MLELMKVINNQKIIAQTLKSLPPLKTTVMDNIYKNRQNHPFPQIGVEEIADLVSTVPVVRRGAPGVSLNQETGSIMYIEPQPIRIEDTIGAKDANDLKALGKDWQTFLASKLDRFRRKIRATTEALSAQSLDGKIEYPLLLSTGEFTTYEVDFTHGGTNPIGTYTPPVRWNDPNASLKHVVMDLTNIVELLQKKGYGSQVRFWAGKEVYSALIGLIESAQTSRKTSSITAIVEGASINIAGFNVELLSSTYTDPRTGNSVKIIDDKVLLAWDEDAPFTFKYLAIDHFKAGLKPMPMFVYSYQNDRGDAIILFAESKPLPCPVVKAICKATMIS